MALLALAAACREGRVPGTASAVRMGWEPDVGVTAVPSLERVPSAYVGRFVEGTGQVIAMPTRDAFWLGDDRQRLLVVLVRPAPTLEVVPGDRVRVSGRLLTSLVDGALPADADPATVALVKEQDRFLLADVGDVTSWNAHAEAPPPP